MSQLSRAVASWIQTHPGAIYGLTEDDVWMQAVRAFARDRRWKQEVPLDHFMLFMRNCGYSVDTRSNSSGEGPKHFFVLQLPERHKGF